MVIYAYKLYSKKPPFHAWFCRVVISKFFQNNLMVTVIYFFPYFRFVPFPEFTCVDSDLNASKNNLLSLEI